jgi:hypothetical protein
MCCMRLQKVGWCVAVNMDWMRSRKGRGDGLNQVAFDFHVVGLFFTKLNDIAFSTVWLHISQRNVGVLKLKTTEIQQRSSATHCNKVSAYVCQIQYTGTFYMKEERIWWEVCSSFHLNNCIGQYIWTTRVQMGSTSDTGVKGWVVSKIFFTNCYTIG